MKFVCHKENISNFVFGEHSDYCLYYFVIEHYNGTIVFVNYQNYRQLYFVELTLYYCIFAPIYLKFKIVMKTRNLLSVMMTLLMAAFMSISFTACGSDDDDKGGNSSGTDSTTSTLVVKVNNAELIFICVPGGTYDFTISP